MAKPLRKMMFGTYSVQFTIREEGYAVWNRTCTDAPMIAEALEVLRAMIISAEAAAELNTETDPPSE